MNIKTFLEGFFKQAAEKEEEQGGNPLPRYVSNAGPRLDEITEETDRSKFQMCRG